MYTSKSFKDTFLQDVHAQVLSDSDALLKPIAFDVCLLLTPQAPLGMDGSGYPTNSPFSRSTFTTRELQ